MFGPTQENTNSCGHVVFIESLPDNGNTVVFSECNRTIGVAVDDFALSNGEIEVRNKFLPNAMDGYKQTMTRTDFNSLHKFALTGNIYKKQN